MTNTGRRRAQRGQGLVETAVVVGVLLSMLMGVYAVAQYASDQNTAGTATRAGARLAAELGNGGYNGSTYGGCQANAKDPCAVDRQIVQSVCQIAAAMPFVTSIVEVDVYRPTGSGGSGDLIDKYTSCASGAAAASAAYTLDNRVQTHPNESYVGISITYNYKSPVPILPLSTTSTVYTVTQLSPHFS